MAKLIGAIRWFAAIQVQFKAADSLRWELSAKDRETAAVMVFTHDKLRWLPSDLGVVYAPTSVSKWYGRDCWSYQPKGSSRLIATANFHSDEQYSSGYKYCEGFIKVDSLPIAIVYANNRGKRLAEAHSNGLPVVHYKEIHEFLMANR